MPVDLPDNTEVDLVEVTEYDLDEEEDALLGAEIDAARAEIARGEPGTPAEEFIDELLERSGDDALSGDPAKAG